MHPHPTAIVVVSGLIGVMAYKLFCFSLGKYSQLAQTTRHLVSSVAAGVTAGVSLWVFRV